MHKRCAYGARKLKDRIQGKFFGICGTVSVIFAPCGQRDFVQNSHVDRMKGGARLAGRLSTGEIPSCQISRDSWMHRGESKKKNTLAPGGASREELSLLRREEKPTKFF